MATGSSNNIVLKLALLGGLTVAGCAEVNPPTTQPVSVSDRQDKALNDPFGYGPDKDFAAQPRKADSKGTFKSDWDHFWDP